MIATVLAIFLVSGIAALLAALLVVADQYVNDYGDCQIVINDEKRLQATGGDTLLETLVANQIFVPSACGGRGTCAYCKVKVLEGGGAVLPTEEPFLSAEERAAGVRLSCQIKIRQPLRIEIPESLFRIQEFSGTCVGISELTHDIREFRFKLSEPKAINYVPGQYMQLLTPVYAGNEEVYRAYSISADPSCDDTIEFVIRLVPGGICTTWCFEHLKEGDVVRMNGPYGDFHLSDTNAPIIFIAGGSGMAPVKCLLHHMRNTDCQRDAVFHFGANQVRELFYHDEMAMFERELHSFRYAPVVANPEERLDWSGETGLVTDAVDRGNDDLAGHEAYLCGSPGMIDACIDVLTRHGMPEDKIFYDKFA